MEDGLRDVARGDQRDEQEAGDRHSHDAADRGARGTKASAHPHRREVEGGEPPGEEEEVAVAEEEVLGKSEVTVQGHVVEDVLATAK